MDFTIRRCKLGDAEEMRKVAQSSLHSSEVDSLDDFEWHIEHNHCWRGSLTSVPRAPNPPDPPSLSSSLSSSLSTPSLSSMVEEKGGELGGRAPQLEEKGGLGGRGTGDPQLSSMVEEKGGELGGRAPLVGYVMMSKGTLSDSKKEYHYVYWLVVDPKYRRLGIAKKLMNKMISIYPRIHNIDDIYLYVRSRNLKAKSLYTSLGFKVEKRIENFYSKCGNDQGDDGLFMRLSNLKKLTRQVEQAETKESIV
jgi:ribosomal protein S18 acetylase RimI-like enzyme